MTIEQILEILENYKLRIPPTVFYDLKADIVNFEEPTTKNDLGVERQIKEICISYPKSNLKEHDGQPYYSVKYIENGEEYEGYGTYKIEVFMEYLKNYFIPSVTPQEPQSFEWCETCKEYDQEKHCCHRWSKVIRNTVEELKQEYIEREVLDKIRAEIKALSNANPSYWHSGDMVDRDDVLEILDKYKTENNS